MTCDNLDHGVIDEVWRYEIVVDSILTEDGFGIITEDGDLIVIE